MTVKRFVSSAVATVMVMDMLLLALVAIPVNTGLITGDAPAAATETQQEAGLFGCAWTCVKCAVTLKSCRKCVDCLVGKESDVPTPGDF